MSCKSPFVSLNIGMSLLMPSIDSNIILNDQQQANFFTAVALTQESSNDMIKLSHAKG